MRIIQHNGFGANTPPREVRKKNVWASDQPSTVVIEGLPENDQIIGLVTRFVEGEAVDLTIQVGVANCHPNDDYCRKIGKEVAYRKIQTYLASLVHASVSTGTIKIRLKTRDGDLYLVYVQGKRPVLECETFA